MGARRWEIETGQNVPVRSNEGTGFSVWREGLTEQLPSLTMADQPDEDRFIALQYTDERLAAEIEGVKTEIGILTGRCDVLESRSPSFFKYNFHIREETIWAILTAVGAVLFQASLDVDKITDWKAWAIGVGAALVRAVLGVVFNLANKAKPAT